MDDEAVTFGAWLQPRGRAPPPPQGQLAQRVACSPALIRALEAEARRPSHEIAERLAQALELAPAQQPLFVRVARGELASDHLAAPPLAPLPLPAAPARAGQPGVAPQSAVPPGTVTWLLTDIQGSTALWDQQPGVARAALARHDALV